MLGIYFEPFFYLALKQKINHDIIKIDVIWCMFLEVINDGIK